MNIRKLFIVSIIFILGCTPNINISQNEELPPTPTINITPIVTVPSTPTSTFPFEEITFITQDNINLSGRLFEGGATAIIFAHHGYATQDTWYQFAKHISGKGYTALTFDFRGNGDSEGILMANKLIFDLRAAITYLTSNGYENIICIGASFGGTACIKAALEYSLTGLVVIGSRMSEGSPTEIKEAEFPLLSMPKLFVIGEQDHQGDLLPEIQLMYDLSTEPKNFVTYPESAHGTDLFRTKSGNKLKILLENFITNISP